MANRHAGCRSKSRPSIEQLTRIAVNPHAAQRSFDSQDLGDLPFLYTEDPGWMVLTKEERAGLRRYLLNGGFMWVDDFWGDAEWSQFEQRMREVLPELQWREITPEHAIFHTVFDVNTMPQIPALPFAMRGGGTAEPPSAHKYSSPGSTDTPHMRGWFDDKGRLAHRRDVQYRLRRRLRARSVRSVVLRNLFHQSLHARNEHHHIRADALTACSTLRLPSEVASRTAYKYVSVTASTTAVRGGSTILEATSDGRRS